jgi:hypothetical protein
VALNFPAWQTHACLSPKLHQMYPVPKEHGPTPTTSDTNFEDNWNCPLFRLNFDTLPALQNLNIYILGSQWILTCSMQNMWETWANSWPAVRRQFMPKRDIVPFHWRSSL